MLGLIGKKIGMTQVFNEEGVLTPVTVVEIGANVVLARREKDRDGYEAVLLASGEAKVSRLSKPVIGQFKEGIDPKKHIMEFRDFEKDCKLGDSLGVEIFDDCGFVDVVGLSKGKGFQGVMKRHNYRGGRASHGSKFHRAKGSTGMAAWPSKVLKGTGMAGRMGGERNTVQNLEVVRVDHEKNIVLLKGAVPGSRNSVLVVRQAKKRK